MIFPCFSLFFASVQGMFVGHQHVLITRISKTVRPKNVRILRLKRKLPDMAMCLGSSGNGLCFIFLLTLCFNKAGDRISIAFKLVVTCTDICAFKIAQILSYVKIVVPVSLKSPRPELAVEFSWLISPRFFCESVESCLGDSVSPNAKIFCARLPKQLLSFSFDSRGFFEKCGAEFVEELGNLK